MFGDAFEHFVTFMKNVVAWWVIVQPWEQAIIVRLGNKTRIVNKGMYFKVPFIDVVYVQNTRRRVISLPTQTMSSKDGKTITLHGSLGYKITNVELLYLTLHDAKYTIQQEVQGLITDYVVQHSIEQCAPALIISEVRGKLDLEKYGLGEIDFFLTGYVGNIRTYRLIQDKINTGNDYDTDIDTSYARKN
jgi:hypothetical protein